MFFEGFSFFSCLEKKVYFWETDRNKQTNKQKTEIPENMTILKAKNKRDSKYLEMTVYVPTNDDGFEYNGCPNRDPIDCVFENTKLWWRTLFSS